jgi:pre-60S factor REI1
MRNSCPQCQIDFDSRESLFSHYKTDFHRTNLILHSRRQPILTETAYQELKAAEQSAPPPPPPPASEEEEEADLNPENYHKIPRTECLFCNSTFDTPELTLDHMSHHGFRFCYPEQLLDAESLMGYFSEKVGIGHSCVNCNKQFKSIQAVRNHMIAKSHCYYELDDEYEEFYEKNTGVVAQQGWVDEVGELHMNGKIYGHRMYQRYYKQKLRDPEEIGKTRRQAIAGPMAPRESFGLANDAIARKREYFRQKYVSKRERRLVSKDYHPFSDIHRGNA